MEHKLVDLFAGAGGLSCGLEMSGFTPIFANEINKNYAETYKINHPNTEVLVDDIRTVYEKDLSKHLNVEKGELDLLAGGPPCQGFSINAPIRSLDDERNHLFKDFIRVAEILSPKAILIENVPGIISLGRGTVIEQIYKELTRLNYIVSHKILFAGHYGVPQTRFRTIIIAIKKHYTNTIIFPEPKYNSQAKTNFTGAKELCLEIYPLFMQSLKPQTTTWDAISDLPEIRPGDKNGTFEYNSNPHNDYQELLRMNSKTINNHYCNKLAEINLQRLKHIPQGGSWRDIPYELLPEGLKRAKRSDHTKRYGRLHPDGLCSTVLTKCDPHWGSFFHPYQDRVISVREAARIQSFPDSYIFNGNLTKQYEQVGNAVPPLMAKEIGNIIIEMLSLKYERQKKSS